MYKVSSFNKSLYKMREVADLLGVTTKTIQNYANSGKLSVVRSDGNHRLIEKDSLLLYLDERGLLFDDTASCKKDVIYARVSSHEQKEKGDLDRQVLRLLENFDGINNPCILKEVGSGLNDKRKQLMKLINMVMEDKVNKVYITYKDRLTRFGFNYLEQVFLNKGVEIVVLDTFENEKNVQDELVDDMMSLIASFSGKLYGMGSSKKKKLISEIESL